MNTFWIFWVGLSFLTAVAAIWSTKRLNRELSQIKRDYYYLEQKVKALPQHIHAEIEPLRIHTANLARGQGVSDTLIRQGRLYHEISSAEALAIMENNEHRQDILLLDVRSHTEFLHQRVPEAKHLAIEDLEMQYQTEIPFSLEKIIVYCASGDRSRLACDFLSQHYTNV